MLSPIHGLSHESSFSPESILFRVDSGANMFVGNHTRHFARLVMQKVGVELGTSSQGHFDGVGVIPISLPGYPHRLFFLYPAFYSSTDQFCTLSTGALRSNLGFTQVLHDAHKRLTLISSDTSHFSLPCSVRDDIDFVTLNVLHLPTDSRHSHPKLRYNHMSLQPASIHHKSVVGTTLFSAWLHVIYAHRSISILQQMIDNGYITGPGLPCKLAPLPGRCPVCDAARMTRVPRIKVTDKSQLPIGTRFHIDYAFFNVTSIRDFTAALIVVEWTSRYLWFFPSRNKSAPLDLCLYFFNQLQRQGYPCIRCRSDEDGALVNNTEFCEMMYKNLGMTLESTGGYASSINGAAESPIKTIKRSIRAMLLGSAMPNPMWCLCGQHSATVYNNIIHRITNKVPSLVLTGKIIPLKRMHPFGARIKVLKHLPAKRALTARTSGDSRDSLSSDTDYNANTITIIDDTQTSSFSGRYVGNSNHPNVLLVFQEGSSTQPHKLARVHHAEVDPHGLSTSSTDTPLPNERILRALHNQVFDTSAPTDWQDHLEPCSLDTVTSPFDPSSCITLPITIPPKGSALGIYVDTDEDYLLPILGKISKDYRLYDEIPLPFHYYTHWIIQIGLEHPLTGQGFINAYRSLQRDHPVSVDITLCPMDAPVRYHHQTYRAYFDSCTSLKYSHMITLPYEPTADPSIYKCLASDLGHEWEQALYHQYDKNNTVRLVAQPTPIENVPTSRTILPAVISTKVKKKGPDLYQLVTRMCANGSKQKQGIDYEFSYSPTAGCIPIRITLCLAASYGWTLAVIDVVNCFQSTPLPQEERLLIHMPPKYLKWFKMRYPDIKLEHSPSGKWVLELLNGLQGDKGIGRKWYLLLKSFLLKFGFSICIHEPSLFIYDTDDRTMLLNTSTDDFLCAFNTRDIYQRLCTELSKLFDITTKEGTILSYLNLRIIQSEYGISYDQTDHIQRKIVNKYFPPSKIGDSTLKAVHTPFRTDSAFETELLETLPATGTELLALEQRYGGSYASILGDIMHVDCWSRFDISYAVNRLASYSHAPNAAAFAGLYRILRYLATHVHRPIMYPHRPLTGHDTLRVDFDKGLFRTINLPNKPCTMADSDHARDPATRKSIQCAISLLNGVVIAHKCQRQKATALHSTHSEIISALGATKQGLHVQNLCTFLKVPPELVRPHPIFLDSQPCIDAVEANTVTTRVKHIAVPIHFIHEHIEASRIRTDKIDTTLNIADSGTKPNPSPTLFRHYDFVIGVRHYPLPDTEHYKLLELHKFVLSPYAKGSSLPIDNASPK